MFTLLMQVTEYLKKKTLLPVSLSVLSLQSVGLMKQPRILSLSSQFLIYEIKSANAKLGERGGWDNMGIPCFTKNSETMTKECASALSCRRNQDPLS
jgi:hypothetical protein